MQTAEIGLELEEGDAVSLCVLRTGAKLFGIDTRLIREVLGKTKPQRVPLAPAFLAGVVPYRGEVLTTVSFRALLGLEEEAGASCVLVLDDTEIEERFGLRVDGMDGVVTVSGRTLEMNPSTLDARSKALFAGVYKLPMGLVIQLDPRQLRPSRLCESELFAMGRDGEQR
jgi:purine-binding chemotaxis protein CheW